MDNSPYERLLGLLCSVLEGYTAVLFLPSTPGDRTSVHRLKAVFSLGDKVKPAAEISPGQGLVGWVIRNQDTLLVPDFDQRRNSLAYYEDNEERQIKAFMGCALPGGLGALCVDSKRQYSFSDKDQKILQLFAGMLADFHDILSREAAQSAVLRYYAAMRLLYVYRREYSNWPDFMNSFLDTLSKASGCEYCALCTLHPDESQYNIEGENYPLLLRGGQSKSYSLSCGMVGWVFRYGKPLANGGPEGKSEALLLGYPSDVPDFQRMMALPLVYQNKVRGVLCLADRLPLELDMEVREFARMAAEHLAQFLENFFIRRRFHNLQQQSARTGEAAGEALPEMDSDHA
ncbi:MAG: GAF domain-containing protein [Deltaproteobacteria bacterium]|jgi:GAF domain-containing protein|nr:GAF domain-containing protein [Deltaproteobacteria bacterium]